MVLPLLVDDLQHQVAFDLGQDLARDDVLLVDVARHHLGPQRVAHFVGAHLVVLEGRVVVFAEREQLHRVTLQGRQVPFVRFHFGADVLLDLLVEQLFGRRHHVAANVADVLFAEVNLPLENLAAQRVDALALLVHHIVILEQVLADGEVLRFDLLLRALDGAADHAMFNRHAFFHAEALHQTRDAVGAEDPHQVVFEREVEAG